MLKTDFHVNTNGEASCKHAVYVFRVDMGTSEANSNRHPHKSENVGACRRRGLIPIERGKTYRILIFSGGYFQRYLAKSGSKFYFDLFIE